MFYYVADLPIEKLQTQVLQLHVFDYDRITRDDSIGEVLLPLWQVLLSVLKLAWLLWLHANVKTTSDQCKHKCKTQLMYIMAQNNPVEWLVILVHIQEY